MRWFYKWLGSKIDNSLNDCAVPEIQRMNSITSTRDNEHFSSEPITFKMFKASGGWAIEFRQYDHKHDRLDTSLYVVNSEEELGKHVSQIITMEALKR